MQFQSISQALHFPWECRAPCGWQWQALAAALCNCMTHCPSPSFPLRAELPFRFRFNGIIAWRGATLICCCDLSYTYRRFVCLLVCFFGRVVLRELFREWGQMTGGHYEMRRRTNHSDSQQEEKQPPYLNPTQKTPRLLKFTDYSEVSIMKLIIYQMLLPPLVFFLELGGSQGVRFHFKFCTQTAMCSSCRYLKPPPTPP